MYSQYLSDPELEQLTGDKALIRQMLRVEIALARVQARLGVIPGKAAKEIEKKLKDFNPDPGSLAAGTLENGIPVIPLLELAKKALSAEAAGYLHWGATSQDITDTATVLIVRDALQVMEKRLQKIIRNLTGMAQKHEHTFMAGRTRSQQAVPVSFGVKVVSWRQPLERHLERIEQLKARLLTVQLGGAGGNLAALGENGWKTANMLADELKLHFSGVWHNQRDNPAELASCLAMLAGSLGKMAQDILLLNQTEVGEVQEQGSAGGRSSTMPHKNNPVRCEAMIALARFAANLVSGSFQALIHQQERDGAALALEYLTLSQLMLAAGASLNHALTVSRHLKVNKKSMQANLERLNGLVYSEQASFLLCRYMKRPEAKAAVAEACRLVAESGISLAEALRLVLPGIDLPWEEVLQARYYQGMNRQLINNWEEDRKDED